MKRILILAGCLVALVACNKKEEPAKEAFSFRISPVLTKVSATSFDNGDAIGVNVYRTGAVHAQNARLTYDGNVFSGDLKWYTEEGKAVVAAYYPYSATAPEEFSVQADQTAGTSSSDFVSGVKYDVTPSEDAVVVPFKHKLSHVVVSLINETNGVISGFALSGVKLNAKLNADWEAAEDPSAAKGTVKAHKAGDDEYDLILPPQTSSVTAVVTLADGKELSQSLDENTFEAGKEYTLTVIVEPDAIYVVLSGDIEDWEEGGEIAPSSVLVEKLSDGYILYHEDKYTVAQMQDGKWWMTQNMRYVPEGLEPSNELTDVTAGVFYPLVVNAEQTAAEFSRDITVIKARGYLYQAEVALGLQVGDLTSVEEAEALEGTRGICPKGWHVPTGADIIGLVGKAVSPLQNNPDAPYFDGANGSIALLNEDGFNMEAYGAISIQDNTKTAGTFMGFMAAYPDRLASGMFCGSTYAGVTYNTKDDPDSGVKNLQFFGLMPMTNKASEADYTCNGTKVSYRIAAPLRCVRDSE